MASDDIKIIKSDIRDELTFFEKYSHETVNFLVEYGPKIIIGLIVLVIGFWLIKKLTHLSEKSMHRKNIDVSLSSFLRSLISVILKVLLIITVAEMIGIKTTSLVTVLGAAGLAIGLALQGSLSNFAGGVLILIFKPYKIGDTIEALGQKGEVKEIQIFNTILLTGDKKTIILPNGSVSNSLIVNQSKEGILRGNFTVTISNKHKSEDVKKVIRDIISQDKRVLTDMGIGISCIKAGGGTYTLQINIYTPEGVNGDVISDSIEKVNAELATQSIGESMQEMIVHLDNNLPK